MAKKKPVMAAFGDGSVPTIACFNKSTTPLGIGLDDLIQVMQKFVDQYVAPVWGTPARLVKSNDFLPNAWAIVFLDDADEPNALAYHDLTPEGLPLSKVFVRTTQRSGEQISVAVTHELAEMLVDPAINLLALGPDGTVYAYESADPVEALSFEIDGVAVTDFVYPSYFEAFHAPGSVQFDCMNKVSEPLEILQGGYQLVLNKDGTWSQLTNSLAKMRSLKAEDRRGHRSEQRKAARLVRSTSPNALASVAPYLYVTMLDRDYQAGARTMPAIASNRDPYVLKQLQYFDPAARWDFDTSTRTLTKVWSYSLENEKTGQPEPAGIYQS